jgi:hypothetical protein
VILKAVLRSKARRPPELGEAGPGGSGDARLQQSAPEVHMSTEIPSRPAASRSKRGRPWTNGYTVFAVAAMTVLCVWQALVGVAALLRDGLYNSTPAYTYSFDLVLWGWVHLLLGVLIGVAGVAVLLGRAWSGTAAISLVSVSMIMNFLFLPHYPVYSLVIIAVDAAVIWALTTYRQHFV